MHTTKKQGSNVKNQNDQPAGKVEKAKQKLVNLINQDNLGETIATHILTPEDSPVPSHSWSLHNQLLVAAAGYEMAAGFKQWQQLGRHVQEGETSFYILAPKTRTITEEEENEETGETEEVKKTIVIGSYPVAVFGYSQTAGDELDLEPLTPQEPPKLESVARKVVNSLKYRPTKNGEAGAYNPHDNSITMKSHDDRVLWHELGHALHYEVRDLETNQGQDPWKEVVAETTAGVLACLYDDEQYVPNTKSYIERYAKEQEMTVRNAVSRAIPVVEDSLDKLFELKNEVKDQ